MRSFQKERAASRAALPESSNHQASENLPSLQPYGNPRRRARRLEADTTLTEIETNGLIRAIQQHFDHPYSWALDERVLLDDEREGAFLISYPGGAVQLGSLLLDIAVKLVFVNPSKIDFERYFPDLVLEISGALLDFASGALPATLAVRSDPILDRRLEDVSLRLFRELCRLGRDISTPRSDADNTVAKFAGAQMDALAMLVSDGAVRTHEGIMKFWQPHALQARFLKEAETELSRLSSRVSA